MKSLDIRTEFAHRSYFLSVDVEQDGSGKEGDAQKAQETRRPWDS